MMSQVDIRALEFRIAKMLVDYRYIGVASGQFPASMSDKDLIGVVRGAVNLIEEGKVK